MVKSSRFASRIGLSPIAALDEKVRALTLEGREIVNFGVGQPDFPTPEAIGEAGIEAIRNGMTRYTSPMGSFEMREAVAEKLRTENRLEYAASEILISSGSKQALHCILAAVLSPGEEVILPTPAWASYPAIIRLLGGEPCFVETRLEDRFKLTPEKLKKSLSPRVTGLLINSPCNPTGAVYSPEELRALAAVIKDAGLWVVADEIYERIVFGSSRHTSLPAVEPELRDKTAIVSGVSKSFSMTGWRIGYAAGPSEWIRTASSIQSHQAGSACSISQEAARYALVSSGDDAANMRAAFERRRDITLELLCGVEGLELLRPEGTFYAFPRVSSFLGPRDPGVCLSTDEDLAGWLLDEAAVATVPGTAFAAPGHLRISYAVSDDLLTKGLKSLRRALVKLGPVLQQ